MVNVFAVVAFTVPLLNFEVQGRGQQNQEQDGNRLIGWTIEKARHGGVRFWLQETGDKSSGFQFPTCHHFLPVSTTRSRANSAVCQLNLLIFSRD